MESRDLPPNQDLDRVVFVTRHFTGLQGFRRVGFGLFILGMTLGDGFHLAGMPALVLRFLFGGLSILVQYRAQVYYTARFGEVKAGALGVEPRLVWAMLALWLGWLAALVMKGHDGSWGYTGFAGVFLISIWCYRGFRFSQSYNLALGLLVLSTPFLWGRSGVLEMMGGVALIVAGLLDHRQLVQALSHGEAFERDAMSEEGVEA
jgi:hypothetical protein